MSDALKRLIAESEQPLSGAAATVIDGLAAHSLQVRAAKVLVPRDVLSRDKVVFVFETSRGVLEVPYSPRFSEDLIRLGVRMTEPDSEAVRIGKLLLDNLRYPDIQYGRHYTDAVLWEVLSERFGSVTAIRRALDGLTHHSPTGDSGDTCAQYLRESLNGAGNTIAFGWPEPQASKIFAGAVYYLLDVRHHISARRALFPGFESPSSEAPTARSTQDDNVDGMVPGLWVGPHDAIPEVPGTLVSAILPRLDMASATTEFVCLDLVRVETVEPPDGWAWLVLSEAGVYTYAHTIGLMGNESWRFVGWEHGRPVPYEVSFEKPLAPDEIVAAYGPEALNRSRQDRRAVQLRLRRVRGS